MTVPPNYGPSPDQPQTPGYGYQSPYGGGQTPYGSQPQQPSYGGGQPYGQPTSPYGGGPVLPPEPPGRNLGLIGGIVVGATVLVLGAVLLVTLNLRGDGEDIADGGEKTSSAEASEEATSPQEDPTTEEAAGSEVGQCLPYSPTIAGDGLALVDCSDATAFWTITAQSYDVDAEVDAEGNLVDSQVAYDLCGAGWGAVYPGGAWQTWHTVYSSGVLDSLYCYEATGAADPEDPDKTPVIPDTGDCFDDSDSWWTVDCGSGSALYEVQSTVTYDDPVPMSKEELDAEGLSCGTDWYFSIVDFEDNVLALLCANDL
ncbi:hypothetical protein LO763_07770 [Glycomyces sp. A-F 0318]|uniref:resistance to Congo red protein n=1 Tax=Glycomyces amatae TaxID=2881355 RepID=UPI001E2834A7|nr:resistance to Congo red protein [Glycomyces amatae]MCD0443524.1 hypothetical protein [Glycomyces amatae]